jgi:hypothetical protein
VVTIRLILVANQVVRPTLTAFMQGRYIMDGVVTLHERSISYMQKVEWGCPKNQL